MSYSHLSIIEFGQLEALHRLGWTIREIGWELKRHLSTIARELKRGKTEELDIAQKVQAVYEERRTASIPEGKYTQSWPKRSKPMFPFMFTRERIAGRSGEFLVGMLAVLGEMLVSHLRPVGDC